MNYLDVVKRNMQAAMDVFGTDIIPADSKKIVMTWNAVFPDEGKTYGIELTRGEIEKLKASITDRMDTLMEVDLLTRTGCCPGLFLKLFHDFLPDGTHTTVELLGGMQKITRRIDQRTEQVIYRDTTTGEEYVFKTIT